ncbi:uncharacterized protein LOC127836285 isoform X1 [Dreissena polymorpha]|uniref:Uncharacterized protein n=1 Tax=Dreissena polymorpha TaxID=45954 RepID=A0A9D4JCT8_DREPO|nr:uncharacterized protein LOC127836285 isoform X1 [Dreissena polymorpha]KAH3807080.1 hypothetical protein DPMN_135413 [Dreissena polymorpha]
MATLEIIVGLLLIGVVVDARSTGNDVRVVHVVRFDGNLDVCREGEVCADVFNFTRLNEDGSGQLESRFIQNCQCPGAPCLNRTSGHPQLLFRETTKQSMLTCEEARMFDVCAPGQIAKEQHNIGDYVYYKINCVCPANENPGGFKDKMTEQKRYLEMTEIEKAYADMNPRSRFFKCREQGAFSGFF